MDETALAIRCAEGDEQAWNALLHDYSAYIHTSVTRTLARHGVHNSPDTAEEIFSEVVLGLIENNGRRLRAFEGRNGSKLSTYLWVVASRCAVDHLRKLSRRPSSDVCIDDSLYDPACLRERPDEALESTERAAVMEDILSTLNEDDRRFVYLYYELELLPEEVAARLDVTVSTVYSKKNRLKSKLGKIFRKKYPEASSKFSVTDSTDLGRT
jgi:RNA polymerase sigma-70 factor (ECF subfamily)